LNHVDLFSGIGGFALAASWCWGDEYVNVGHSEIEKFPCQVYHKHFPESRCLGDITKIEWGGFKGAIDLLTGGFPCQPFSLAGKRKQKEDERWLWPAMLKAITACEPRYVVGENVGGARSVIDEICSDLESRGYSARPIILEAGSFGADTIRERIWFIANTAQAGNNKRVKSYQESKTSRRADILREYAGGEAIATEQYFKSRVRRIIDGLPAKLDKHRIQSLGNAIVPQVAFEIMKAIKEHDSMNQSERSEW